MSEIPQGQLLGYLLGALEDREREQLEDRLRSDPRLRQRLASARRSLDPLRDAPREIEPPPGLARRTCLAVAALAESAVATLVPSSLAAARRRRRRGLSPEAAPPSGVGSWTRLDVLAAACVFLLAALLTFPALQRGRLERRRMAHLDAVRNDLLSQEQNAYARLAPLPVDPQAPTITVRALDGHEEGLVASAPVLASLTGDEASATAVLTPPPSPEVLVSQPLGPAPVGTQPYGEDILLAPPAPAPIQTAVWSLPDQGSGATLLPVNFSFSR